LIAGGFAITNADNFIDGFIILPIFEAKANSLAFMAAEKAN
jgi:hypothetical protein